MYHEVSKKFYRHVTASGNANPPKSESKGLLID